MTFRNCIWLVCLLMAIAPLSVVHAQSADRGANDSIEKLTGDVEAGLQKAREETLDFLSPRHFGRAQNARDEARSLIERKSDGDLIRIKLKQALDELEAARKSAAVARDRLGGVLAARTAAVAVGADSLSAGLWKRTEERLHGLLLDLERSAGTVSSKDAEDVAGAYRAARRDALRSGILNEARSKVEEAERKGGAKAVPTLLLRAHQAISRAEADLAQENLDAARAEAQAAIRVASHAVTLMDYIARAQDSKQPWEAALLPYDDLVQSVAEHLGGTVDLSKGGANAGPQLLALIDARQETLATRVVDQQETLKSLEASLAEAQTSLADAQRRIEELEKRLRAVEGERAVTRQQLQQSDLAEWVKRAQTHFKAGEATVEQNADGTVTIRLTGLKYGAGATNLDKTRQRVVDRAASAVEQFPGATIRVEGHTDAEGSEDVNQRLSVARAEAVARRLAAKLQIPEEQIQASGFGESRPLGSNDTAAGRARNRRIDIVLTVPQ